MSERDYGLVNKALAAYKSSELEKADQEAERELIAHVTKALKSLGVAVEATSCPFTVEGLEFSCYRQRIDDDIDLGYFVHARKTCERCGEWSNIEVLARSQPACSLAEFGQWLARRHDCNSPQEQNRATGFIQRQQSR